jgi:hypothetical protein
MKPALAGTDFFILHQYRTYGVKDRDFARNKAEIWSGKPQKGAVLVVSISLPYF